MSSVVHFSPELTRWLQQELDQGRAPSELTRVMVAERMQPRVASAIVEAFVAARAHGRPVPQTSVQLEDDAPYLPDAPRLAPGQRLQAFDRELTVRLRLQRPQLALVGNVLDDDERRQLIALGRPRLSPSTTVDATSGHDVASGGRTSFGMFFRLRETPFIARLEQRFAALMGLPQENGEGLQLLYYPAGTESAPHFDYLTPDNPQNRASLERSGQRVSTLVAYLNEVEAGGETLFPELGLSIAPTPGDALYFEYANLRGQVDPSTLHAGRTIHRGEKWVVTKWVRERRFVSA